MLNGLSSGQLNSLVTTKQKTQPFYCLNVMLQIGGL